MCKSEEYKISEAVIAVLVVLSVLTGWAIIHQPSDKAVRIAAREEAKRPVFSMGSYAGE